MEERTHGIVNMRRMNIAERGERLCVGTDRLQLFHRNLNVNDRFRFQPRHCRRAVVVDATSEFSEGSRKAIPFRLEFKNPARIVQRDLQSVDHDRLRGLRSTTTGRCCSPPSCISI
jgi:hypothetical protein